MRRIAVLDAPSNLGLRPPTETSVPGCAKAPGALRDHGLLPRLNARDAGCLTPPRYDPGDWRPGDGVCHAGAIAVYSRALADRIGAIIDVGEFPVVLGGDCSIVLGSALAMHRLGEAVGGRIGLVFVDGHSDFRHPGNASYVGAAAGEDLALATGRGQADLAAIEGRRPYFRDIDVVVMGIRSHDEYRLDLQAAGIVTRPVPTLRAEGAARSAQWAREQLVDCAGYWVHVDVDVLDPAVMPAVDAPEPGGIAFTELELLLAGLVDTPHCLGVEITVFDPDYDPDGSFAEEITATVVAGLAPVRVGDAPPADPVANRARDAGDAAADRAEAADRAATLSRIAPPAAPTGVPSAAPTGVPSAGPTGVPSAGPSVVPAAAPPAAPQAGSAVGPLIRPRVSPRDVLFPQDARGAARTGDIDDRSFGASRVRSPLLGPVRDDSGWMDPPDAADNRQADAGRPDEGAYDAGRPDIDEADVGEAGFGEADIDEAGVDEAGVDDLGVDDPDAEWAEVDGPDAGRPDPDGPRREPVDQAAEGDTGDDVPDDAPVAPDADEAVTDEAAAGGERPYAEHRPLGLAPQLDSTPLPATMPGMLRPRAPEPFSLPTQRPAFDHPTTT